MYDFIEGTLEEKQIDCAIIAANGIGFCIYIPINAQTTLPGIGETTKLFTSFIVREDAHRLFGFPTKGQRDFFNVIKEISGIGPKTALALLGHLDNSRLYDAIQKGHASVIAQVPGIGKKTAERVIIELRDKKMAPPTGKAPEMQPREYTLKSDAISALVNLGYTTAAAEPVIERSLQEMDNPKLPELITRALQNFRA